VDLSDYWKSGTWDIIEVPAYLNVHNDTGNELYNDTSSHLDNDTLLCDYTCTKYIRTVLSVKI
jgi:hypothetical protein